MTSTPKGDGFRVPAEWEPHERTWVLWPLRADTWRQEAQPAQKAFAQVANAISAFEPVTVGVPSGSAETAARALLREGPVTIVHIEYDDVWIRDTGPIFVVREDSGGLRTVRGVDWRFNSWGGSDGGCYWPCDKDELVARRVLDMAGAQRYAANMILEGGSVHVDGEGTALVTEECLLNANRNPDLSRECIESCLRAYFGVDKVLWLGRGVVGDTDTDGHVDNLCAFVRPGEVVLHWTDDETDEQHAISRDALARLESCLDAKGRRIKVHKLPMPGPLYWTQDEASTVRGSSGGGDMLRVAGTRLPASYANFYVVNGGVVMPGFGVPEDVVARRLLEGLFPERRVVQVHSREILLGGGNIHCTTQQQPAARSNTSTTTST